MNRVLALAYHFPPIGGAGAQRPAKFVRYLPAYGYEATVVTGPGDSVGRWTPLDRTLAAEVADATKVFRLPASEPLGRSEWKNKAQRWFGLRSEWARWWIEGAVAEGREHTEADLIYAWMSPYESAEAARRLATELGKPWIADLGDPWALDEMIVFPSAIHRLRELRRMGRLLGSAAAIVMSTPEAARRVRDAFPELRSKPIVWIPNGFDASDFDAEAADRDDGVFRIVHTGYLHTELGQQQHTPSLRRLLRGEAKGVDILTRSHVYLLDAIERLLERKPELRSRIEVHLAGVLSETDKEVAARSDVVRLHGYLPHADSIALLRSADLLFLPMQNLPPGTRSSTVPGKTYEYVASGLPILAAVPDGDARDILEATGRASICRPDDVDAMTRIISSRLEDPTRIAASLTNGAGLGRFEYRNLSGRIADVFDRVVALEKLSQRPFVADVSRRALPPPQRAADVRKKVMHIAYYFPPIGGAGAQRGLKFVRYLPLYGYESTVITGSGAAPGRWTPTDETLSHEIGDETEIRRVTGPEPQAAHGWRGRAERWLGLTSAWSTWWTEGVVNMGMGCGDVEVILASMSPYESAEAAARLAKRLRKPWVAGLRDPWALDEMMVFPSGLHRLRELRRMRRLLSSAAGIVVTTQETAVRIWEEFPELRAKPIVAIPNGFDESDFAADTPVRDEGVFRIVHTGYLHTELGRQQRRSARLRRLLGGQTKGVDILTRSHVYLLQAVERLLERQPELRSRIEIHLAGVLSEADKEVAGRSDVVRLHGYLPHAESIALLRSADLLFLPMQDLPAGTRSSTVPGKTYEYLAAGRPILAAVPEGDVRDILNAAGNAYVCSPTDSAGLAEAIATEIERRRSGQLPAAPPPRVLNRFERKFLTAELASVLDAVTGLDGLAREGAAATPRSAGRLKSARIYAAIGAILKDAH